MAKKKKNHIQPMVAAEPTAGTEIGIETIQKPVETSSGTKPCVSPSVSRTLGEVNSNTESLQSNFDGNSWKVGTAYEVLEESPQQIVGKVFVKMSTTPDTPKAPWLDLFKDNRNVSQDIKLNIVEENGEDEFVLEDQDLDEVEKAWGFCLVGYFAAKFSGLLQLCESWNVKYKNIAHSSGWLEFKFDNTTDRDKVLNGGPYFIFSRPLLLKIMLSCFEFDDDEIRTVPIWINLPDLPLKYWNAIALGKITSRVGKPVSTNKLTRTIEWGKEPH
ncbi:hypothetical protein Pfo_031279 [Paulownia fortunei]|nr:hypothetical protein Pfo_031279 [Paulownia fortunei]